MKISRLSIEAPVLNELIAFLKRELSTKYVHETSELVLLAGEEYRLRTGSFQMHLVVIRKSSGKLEIELVCGGGGEGIFNFSLGSEGAFIKRTKRLLREFCQEHHALLNEIQ